VALVRCQFLLLLKEKNFNPKKLLKTSNKIIQIINWSKIKAKVKKLNPAVTNLRGPLPYPHNGTSIFTRLISRLLFDLFSVINFL